MDHGDGGVEAGEYDEGGNGLSQRSNGRIANHTLPTNAIVGTAHVQDAAETPSEISQAATAVLERRVDEAASDANSVVNLTASGSGGGDEGNDGGGDGDGSDGGDGDGGGDGELSGWLAKHRLNSSSLKWLQRELDALGASHPDDLAHLTPKEAEELGENDSNPNHNPNPNPNPKPRPFDAKRGGRVR